MTTYVYNLCAASAAAATYVAQYTLSARPVNNNNNNNYVRSQTRGGRTLWKKKYLKKKNVGGLRDEIKPLSAGRPFSGFDGYARTENDITML